MKPKVYILDSVHPLFKARLAHKFDIQEDFSSGRDTLTNNLSDAHGVIIRSRIQFDKAMIDAAPQLQFLARVGAGMESIDVDYAEKKGIHCLNSPEGNRDAVAEHTMGMLLNLLNHLNRCDRQVRNGVWQREENRGMELKKKTVGIIGFGNMGSEFAARLQGFSCKVLAYDKYKTDYAPDAVTECDMDTIFRDADVVSLHIPLDEKNFYLADESWFNAFHKPIVLLNTSRGHVVKTSALVDALKNGKVQAAGLDVIEYEEHSFESTKNLTEHADFKALAVMDNVLFSPHIAGWTAESKIKLAEVLIEKIVSLH
ncbi:MAG: NAD(P)-dependent oxidoreductase [Bacteroidota bacterium]|nr:NAD(P)-dependent oxidoreductase [Bacteroidota bacterium]